MYEVLDGPAKQTTLSVTNAAVVEAKVGTTAFSERKVVTIQPTSKNVYVYFGDNGTTPSVTTVQNDGIKLYKNGVYSFEATDTQPIWLLAVSGTSNVKVVERA